MSNMLKAGHRQSLQRNVNKSKKHIKEFYRILSELNSIAIDIKNDHPKEEYSDEFITEIFHNYSDRELGTMELTLLGSKLNGTRLYNTN